jgi:Protein of unknown function (DUF541)
VYVRLDGMQPDRANNTITVTGEALVDTTPDETRFRIMLTALRPAAEEALEDVTIRSDRLDALLTELGVPNEKRSTAGSPSERSDGGSTSRPRKEPTVNARSSRATRSTTRSSFDLRIHPSLAA